LEGDRLFVDTRTKILTPPALASLDPPRPLLLAVGRFDILRLEAVRDLAAARQRTGAGSLMVALRPFEGELVPLAADFDDDDEYEKKVMTIAKQINCVGCEACSKICPKKCYTHLPMTEPG